MRRRVFCAASLLFQKSPLPERASSSASSFSRPGRSKKPPVFEGAFADIGEFFERFLQHDTNLFYRETMGKFAVGRLFGPIPPD